MKMILAIALLCGPVLPAPREIRHRIAMKPGQERVVAGRISAPEDQAVYVLQLQAGQHVSVQLELGPTLRAYVVLKPSAGEQIGPGVKLDFLVNQPGVLQIRVMPLEQSSGTFRLHLGLKQP